MNTVRPDQGKIASKVANQVYVIAGHSTFMAYVQAPLRPENLAVGMDVALVWRDDRAYVVAILRKDLPNISLLAPYNFRGEGGILKWEWSDPSAQIDYFEIDCGNVKNVSLAPYPLVAGRSCYHLPFLDGTHHYRVRAHSTAGGVSEWTAWTEAVTTGVATVASTVPVAGGTLTGPLVIDSAGSLRSSNFSAGNNGWQITSGGSAEFGNAVIRGTLSTSLFQKDAVSVMGGSLLILSGDKLAGTMAGNTGSTVIGAGDRPSNIPAALAKLVITTDGAIVLTGAITGGYDETVEGGEVLYLKHDDVEEWVRVLKSKEYLADGDMENTDHWSSSGSAIHVTGSPFPVHATAFYELDSGSSIWQDVTVKPLSKLTLDFWSYTDGVHPIRYEIYDNTNAAFIVSPTASSWLGTSWGYDDVSFTVPSGCTEIAVTFYAPVGATGYVDYASLYMTGLPPNLLYDNQYYVQRDMAGAFATEVVEEEDDSGYFPWFFSEGGTVSIGADLPMWASPDLAANYSKPERGGILLSSDKPGSPYISIFTTGASPWTGTTEHVHIGNMQGTYGITGLDWGQGIGSYAGGNYLRYTQDTGFRLQAGTGLVLIDGDGVAIKSGDVKADGSTVRLMDVTNVLELGSLYGIDTLIEDNINVVLETQPVGAHALRGSGTGADSYLVTRAKSDAGHSSTWHAEVHVTGQSPATLELIQSALDGSSYFHWYGGPATFDGPLQLTGDGIYNVKAYGAKGDDSTDDTTAIQAAIDAASAVGGEVVFSTGTYRVVSTLTVGGSVTIRGVGGAVLRGPAILFSITGAAGNYVFDGLREVGSTAGQLVNLASTVDIADLTIMNCQTQYHGINIAGGVTGTLRVQNNRIGDGTSSRAINVGSTAAGHSIGKLMLIGNVVEGTTGAGTVGLVTTGSANMDLAIIAYNHVKNMLSGDGFDLDAGSRRAIIIGNIAEECGGMGMEIKAGSRPDSLTARDVLCSGNLTLNCTEGGIHFRVSGVCSNNIVLEETVPAHSSKKGIFLDSDSDDVRVTGNYIKGYDYGISVEGADDVDLSHNVVDAASVGIYLSKNSGNGEQNVHIANNRITGFATSAVYLEAYASGPAITSRVVIEENDITGGGAGATYGLRIGDYWTNVIVRRNEIANVASAGNYVKIHSNALVYEEYVPQLPSGTGPAVNGGREGTNVYENTITDPLVDLAYGLQGQEVEIIFTNGRTVKDASTTGTFQLAGGVDYPAPAGSTMRFRKLGSYWYEIGGRGTTGNLNTYCSEATATMSGASTVIQVNVPSGARLVGCQLRVDTAITSGDGGTSWSAAYSGGATQSIATGQAFTKNTKVSKFFDPNAASPIASAEVDITITPNSGTFSAGVVRAIAYYEAFTAMANA